MIEYSQPMAKKTVTKKKTAKKKKPAGLWANIHAKHKRIEAGSGEKMRKKGDAGAPTEASIRKSQATAKKR
jgi:hypothetical protein